jgi:D-apiose dehydrogenase
MPPTRIAMIGAGFWSRYQLAAWRELPGQEVVAVCSPRLERARALAAELGVPAAYDDPGAMLERERPDVVDIVTPDPTHAELTELGLAHGAAVICQKPMAPTLAEAERMLAAARAAGRSLLIHENFRWQAPLRALGERIAGGAIGRPFRARLSFSCSFPVFDNQPSLREAERFILLDLGVHLLDVARFLFGDAQRLYCRTASVNPGIRGEDVATVLLDQGDVHTTVELSYASRLAGERFPETFAVVEGEDGSLELRAGYELLLTTAAGTERFTATPPRYAWADPAYEAVHASIVPCHANLLAAVRGEGRAETDAEDNIRSLRLVLAAYESAASGQAVAP